MEGLTPRHLQQEGRNLVFIQISLYVGKPPANTEVIGSELFACKWDFMPASLRFECNLCLRDVQRQTIAHAGCAGLVRQHAVRVEVCVVVVRSRQHEITESQQQFSGSIGQMD
ncbi:hypothetical protein J6590_041181 [Homalodisca vitripennis]|nr:hypothetical protein J6590_041181 [Homalodisca vitripennis]